MLRIDPLHSSPERAFIPLQRRRGNQLRSDTRASSPDQAPVLGVLYGSAN